MSLEGNDDTIRGGLNQRRVPTVDDELVLRHRADQLLLTIAQAGGCPSEEAARFAVRLCRTVDEEIATPTPYPSPPAQEEDDEL